MEEEEPVNLKFKNTYDTNQYIPNQVSDQDCLQNIKNNEEEDDLAELRRMIAKCKVNIGEYADELCGLEKVVNECNQGYKDLGYGVKDDVFWKIERKLNKHIPGRESCKIFTTQDSTTSLQKSKSKKKIVVSQPKQTQDNYVPINSKKDKL